MSVISNETEVVKIATCIKIIIIAKSLSILLSSGSISGLLLWCAFIQPALFDNESSLGDDDIDVIYNKINNSRDL